MPGVHVANQLLDEPVDTDCLESVLPRRHYCLDACSPERKDEEFVSGTNLLEKPIPYSKTSFPLRNSRQRCQAAGFASCETVHARTYRSSSPVRRLVSSLQFANTSASQNQNRRWTLHARVASIVSTSPQAVISPEMPACSHVSCSSQKTGLAQLPGRLRQHGSFLRKTASSLSLLPSAWDITPKRQTGPLSEVYFLHHDRDRMQDGQCVTTALPCAGGPHSTCVWTFAQNTAPAPAGLSTQDTLPEPRVGQLKNACES